MQEKKNLYLFVENFSSPGREEFFEGELNYLCERFATVTVVPLYEGNTRLAVEAPNLKIEQINAFVPCNRLKILLRRFPLVARVFAYEFIKTHNKSFYLSNFRACINNLLLKVAAADALHLRIQHRYSDTVFYSYWFSQWAFILSLLKARHPELLVATRAHGSDYKEEQTGKTLAFRYFQLKTITRVLPVSAYAKRYLETKFKVPTEKIVVSRLGLSQPTGKAPVDAAQLTLVSCSSLIPLKRVHLIAEALRMVTLPLRWFHFGDGPERAALEKAIRSLPANVKAELRGYVPNPDFLRFLVSTPVSFFLNVSENEGIPVTLMEASRLGIPLIGTDTCGVPEIVVPETGFLLPVEFQPQDLAARIVSEHQKGDIYSESYRQRVASWYSSYFAAANNYPALADTLYNLQS